MPFAIAVLRDRFPLTPRLQQHASLSYHATLVLMHTVSSWARSPFFCGFKSFWGRRKLVRWVVLFSVYVFERAPPIYIRPGSGSLALSSLYVLSIEMRLCLFPVGKKQNAGCLKAFIGYVSVCVYACCILSGHVFAPIVDYERGTFDGYRVPQTQRLPKPAGLG